MIYDPRDHGAVCDKCVLSMRRMGTPVPPEFHLGKDQIIVVGDFPDGEAVAEGVPFIGPPGNLAMSAFGSYGLTREQVGWTQACLCRPPDNRMEVIDRETAALNQAAKKKGLPPLFLRPWQACRPRLLRELRGHGIRNVVALGGMGLKTLLNDDSASITKHRGFPAQLGIDVRENGGGLSYVITEALESHFDYSILTRFTVLPSLHPSFVLRQRRWTKIFSGDIGRALRIFRGQDNWVPPSVVYIPTPKQVRDFLLGQRLPFWVHDVETDSKYPLKAKLRCIGFSDDKNCIVVPWLSIDGRTTFYTEEEQAEIDAIVTEFYADRSRIKSGWNSANYDRIVINKKFGVVPFPEMDGLQMHRSIDSELPHNLGFVASCWTEVPRAWKKDHTATDPHSDMDLWIYNGFDNVLTARCIPPLWEAVTERQQVEIVKLDLKVTSICASMHENGLAVDQKRRAEREHECLHGVVIWSVNDVEKWKTKLAAGEMTQADFDKKVAKWEKTRERLVKEVFDKYTGGHVEWQPADPLHYVMSQDGTLLKKGLLHYKTLLQEIAEGLGVFGPKGRFNPNSTDQVAQVIFDKWNYTATEFTDGGKPSTGDDVLLGLMADLTDKKGKIHQAIRYQFFDSLRWFRRLSKELGTYILKFKLETEIRDPALEELAEDLEEAAEEGDLTAQQKLDKLLISKKVKYGCVSLDGRLHSGWRAHAATGRLSSSDPVNCFDATTEILTPRGWVPFPALLPTEEVAQWAEPKQRGALGRIDFVQPSAYIRQRHTGSMVSVQNQHIDLRVTGDHQCLLRYQAESLRCSKRSAVDYPVAGAWAQIHAGVYTGSGLAISDDELRMLVAVQADGTYDDHGGIDFVFRKRRKIRRMGDLLTRLGWPHHSVSKGDKDWRFAIRAGPQVDLVKRWMPDKTFGAWVLTLSRAQMDIFIEELWHWDSYLAGQNMYSSSVKANSDWAQAALALSGVRAKQRVYMPPSGRPNYQLDCMHKDFSYTTNAEKTIEQVTEEPVYCVTVPAHNVVVRRNGRVMVTGQCQNVPAHLRDMIVPGPGNELVTADMDQVELRAVASYARSTPLLEIFDRIYKKRKSGQKVDKLSPIEDPYSMNAAAIFGKEFTTAASDSKDKLRTFAKIFTLASIYGADPIVKWGILRAAEDKEGKLAYLKISQREVRKFHEEWCKANYEIVQWWSDVWAEFKAQGYLVEPVMGRRRDFLDDGDEDEVKKEVYNFKAQAGCSARIHLATIDIVENLIPFNKWGPGTGLIAQVHDSLTFEVPKGLGKALVPQVEERMESRDANVVYTASGLVQQHWGMK